MTIRSWIFSFCILAATSLVGFPFEAHAALGENVDSIARDRNSLRENSHRQKQPVEHSGYVVHEIVSDGINVREFVSNSGKVFAIAWDGQRHPDIAQLLGSYTREMDDAGKDQIRTAPRRARTIRTPRLVLQHFGYSTSFQGRAYDPELLPYGINLNAIK